MASSVSTFLMFDGVAEEAMKFYVSLFKGSEIKQLERFGSGEQGAEGSVRRGRISLAGHELMCFDSPVKHAFTFTPSISLFVECENEAEQGLSGALEKWRDLDAARQLWIQYKVWLGQ